jgi:hypothetical protein
MYFPLQKGEKLSPLGYSIFNLLLSNVSGEQVSKTEAMPFGLQNLSTGRPVFHVTSLQLLPARQRQLIRDKSSKPTGTSGWHCTP